MASLLAWSPSAATAGSPGSTRTTTKTNVSTTSRMGMLINTLRMAYWNMGGYPNDKN